MISQDEETVITHLNFYNNLLWTLCLHPLSFAPILTLATEKLQLKDLINPVVFLEVSSYHWFESEDKAVFWISISTRAHLHITYLANTLLNALALCCFWHRDACFTSLFCRALCILCFSRMAVSWCPSRPHFLGSLLACYFTHVWLSTNHT